MMIWRSSSMRREWWRSWHISSISASVTAIRNHSSELHGRSMLGGKCRVYRLYIKHFRIFCLLPSSFQVIKNLTIVRLERAGVRWKWAWIWGGGMQIGLRRKEGVKISRRVVDVFRREFWTWNLRDAQFPSQTIPLLRINTLLLLDLFFSLSSFQTCLEKNALQLSLQLRGRFEYWRVGAESWDFSLCCCSVRKAVENRRGTLVGALKTRNQNVISHYGFDSFTLLNWVSPSLAVLTKTSAALIADGTEIRISYLGKSKASSRLLVAVPGEECHQSRRRQLLLILPLPHVSRGELGGIPPSRAPCKHLLLGGIVTLAPYFPFTSRASNHLLERFRGEHGWWRAIWEFLVIPDPPWQERQGVESQRWRT